jgi:Na+-transporting NADH:ubiquinone oxidoreductase subunit C
MKKEGTIYTIIFIFIVSVAFVFLLSLTNVATIERVELNEELARQTAVLTAMGIEAESADEIQERYADIAADQDAVYYAGYVDGELVYARQFAGPGLWGTISGVLAVNGDITEIVGLEIVSDNETPGLGGRINEPWFKDQFRGERVGAGTIEVGQTPGEGDSDTSNGVVDGVTGATRTSDSMEAIVNRELETMRSPEATRIFSELNPQGGRS